MRWFLYLHANDVDASRTFYRDVIGLPEVFRSPEGDVVGFRAGDVQLTVAHHDGPAEPIDWAGQLGWEGGAAGVPSWGVELDSAGFVRAVAAASAHGSRTRWPAPHWVGYWSFPVRDPMGNTVEISTPDRHAWTDPDSAGRR